MLLKLKKLRQKEMSAVYWRGFSRFPGVYENYLSINWWTQETKSHPLAKHFHFTYISGLPGISG